MRVIVVLIFLTLSTSLYAQDSILGEIGIVLLQETTFTGLSLLAASEWKPGAYITGGTDLFFTAATIPLFLNEDFSFTPANIGLISVGAGFMAKSVFNIFYSENFTRKQTFWINFISYNILVYIGYYITEVVMVE